MHAQGALQPRLVDHRHVGDDDLFIPKPAQAARHRRFRQADLVRQNPCGLKVVAPDQIEQAAVEIVERDGFLHVTSF